MFDTDHYPPTRRMIRDLLWSGDDILEESLTIMAYEPPRKQRSFNFRKTANERIRKAMRRRQQTERVLRAFQRREGK